MANRYSKKKPRKIEPIPVVATLMVLCIVIFIAVDSTINAVPVNTGEYILRIELSSTIYSNLNGTMTFRSGGAIYEQLLTFTEIPSFTAKTYRGVYAMSFDGEGISIGPIDITVTGVGTIHNAVVNNVQLRIDAMKG